MGWIKRKAVQIAERILQSSAKNEEQPEKPERKPMDIDEWKRQERARREYANFMAYDGGDQTPIDDSLLIPPGV